MFLLLSPRELSAVRTLRYVLALKVQKIEKEIETRGDLNS